MMRLKKSESGASAVEFALIAALLFLVVFGIIQFGIAYNRVQGLQAASREGARIGSLPTSSLQDILDRASNTLSATLSRPTTVQGGQPFSATPGLNNTFLWISRRPAGSSSLVPYTDLAAHPCGSTGGAAEGDSIVISLSNGAQIQLPPVMGFNVTIKGSGEFLCEL